MTVASVVVVEHPSRSRSRLVNAPWRLPNVNGNSSEARYFRDLCLQYATELGDPTRLTEADLTLVRATAGLALEAARLQSASVRGERVDLEQLTRVNNSLARNIAAMKRRRSPKSSGLPPLSELII